MPDINLLDNNHPTIAPEGGAVPHSLNYIGAGILVLVVLFSVGAWYLSVHAQSQDTSVITQTEQVKQQITSMPNYTAFVSEQNSLSGLSFLIKNHLDWSQPAAEIAGVTLQSVRYTNITINQDGTGTLEGTAPSYADLDEYLQALNSKTISPFIASATLTNVATSNGNSTGSQSSTGVSTAQSGLSFTVALTFTKNIWGGSAAVVTSVVPSTLPVTVGP
jgi:hypothetical protein